LFVFGQSNDDPVLLLSEFAISHSTLFLYVIFVVPTDFLFCLFFVNQMMIPFCCFGICNISLNFVPVCFHCRPDRLSLPYAFGQSNGGSVLRHYGTEPKQTFDTMGALLAVCTYCTVSKQENRREVGQTMFFSLADR
jgi:hypothetical protein